MYKYTNAEAYKYDKKHGYAQCFYNKNGSLKVHAFNLGYYEHYLDEETGDHITLEKMYTGDYRMQSINKGRSYNFYSDSLKAARVALNKALKEGGGIKR